MILLAEESSSFLRDIVTLMVAVLVFIPATIGAVATLRGNRTTRAVSDAIDTENQKDLGTTVHDMSVQLEVLSAQTHLNTKEMLEMSAKIDRHIVETEGGHE